MLLAVSLQFHLCDSSLLHLEKVAKQVKGSLYSISFRSRIVFIIIFTTIAMQGLPQWPRGLRSCH